MSATPAQVRHDDGTRRGTSPAVIVGLAAAAMGWAATGTVLLLQPQVPSDRFLLLATTLSVICGAIIVLRTDTPLIGWLLVTAGVTWPLISVFFQGGASPPPETPWTEFFVTLGEVGNGVVFLLLLVFPTGRFDTWFARVGGWIFVVVSLEVPILLLHALGVIRAAPDTPFWLDLAVFFAFIVLGLAMQIRRYRRRPRVEQLQIKWFLFAVASYLLYPLLFALDLPVQTFADVGITATIPVAVLIAITRYRLYDIDRLVSRTVAYALVIATLAVLGIGGVTVVTSLLPTQDRLAVALSTVAVVALFDPLRRRTVDAVDRRFDRTRYVAQQVVEHFGRDVQEVTDVDEIDQRVHAVVARTVAPTTVAVWQPQERTT